MSEIAVKTENVIAVVAQAKTALENGDVSTGNRLFGDAKKAGLSIMKETEYLLERVSAVEKHYKELEKAKSRKIGELYDKENETKKKKEAKIASMGRKESEMRQAESELSSANENLSRARRRKEEAEDRKGANIAGAVGFGLATVFTLGLAAPLTVPGVAVCTYNAVEAGNDEDKAERDISNASSKINRCREEISQCRSEIHQLDDEIPRLSQQIRQLKSERDKIHTQRGEVSDTIKYLRDGLYFWREFGQLAEHGTDRATFLQKLSEYLQLHDKKATNLPRQAQSCISSWECVEKKLEKADQHVFSIDFTCQFCRNSFCSLPHLRDGGQFCCVGCFTNWLQKKFDI